MEESRLKCWREKQFVGGLKGAEIWVVDRIQGYARFWPFNNRGEENHPLCPSVRGILNLFSRYIVVQKAGMGRTDCAGLSTWVVVQLQLESGMQTDNQTKVLLILNGCFSVGKTTVAQELTKRVPEMAYLDSDLFGTLHPHIKPDEFDGYVYVWDAIESVVSVISKHGLSCVMQEAIAPGLTSANPDDIHKRLAKYFEHFQVLTLDASWNRILIQNRIEGGDRYPESVLRKCYDAVQIVSTDIGDVLQIDDDDTLDDIVKGVLRFLPGLST